MSADPSKEDEASSLANRSPSKKSKDGQSSDAAGQGGSKASKLTPAMAEQLLQMNPALRGELAGMDKKQAAEALKKLDAADLMTGLSLDGRNHKDMASHKFWKTQPVPHFGDAGESTEGPIKRKESFQVPKEPRQLYEGFEWVEMDLEDEAQLTEVHELLTGHYVEDKEEMFRLNYSSSILNWALKSPGWKKEWHIGVRAEKSRKLVAFISAIPVTLRVRSAVVQASEVNFLCVHKKLRSKRLAPVLIEEITRRCNLCGIFQAIYTAGTVLPKPISSCRYFHRPLDWAKLYDVGFCGLPHGSTKARQVSRNQLPSSTSFDGLREMKKGDVPAVQKLLKRYLDRFMFAPAFDESEVDHWILHNQTISPERVIWAYVVEDANHKITDFVSFYRLETSVVSGGKTGLVRAAYLFYYASETAFEDDAAKLKERLRVLMQDGLIIAKKEGFDVFNALTLLDNPTFLEPLRFGQGDGQLHYYLYNYRTAPIPGGVNDKNAADESQMGGIGLVMM